MKIQICFVVVYVLQMFSVRFVSPASADELVRLTLTGVTYADGGFATGSITLDYPASGLATVASFNVTLTDMLLNQPPPIGYGSPTVTMVPGNSYFSFIDGPIGTNNTYQLGIYGGGPEPIEFWFDVPNSLITGSPPTDPIQFDPTAQSSDGAWFLVEDSPALQDLVTSGTLGPEILGQQPPVLEISINSDTPTININGVIGTTNQIEYTTDISITNCWRSFTNVVLQSTSAAIIDNSATNCLKRFYRTVVLQ